MVFLITNISVGSIIILELEPNVALHYPTLPYIPRFQTMQRLVDQWTTPCAWTTPAPLMTVFFNSTEIPTVIRYPVKFRLFDHFYRSN